MAAQNKMLKKTRRVRVMSYKVWLKLQKGRKPKKNKKMAYDDITTCDEQSEADTMSTRSRGKKQIRLRNKSMKIRKSLRQCGNTLVNKKDHQRKERHNRASSD